MKTLKELGEMRYAYRKKVRLQKYNNIESRMEFSEKTFTKVYLPTERHRDQPRKTSHSSESAYPLISIYFTFVLYQYICSIDMCLPR